jgi:hypothetical protein
LKTKLGSGNTVDVYSGDKCKNALIQIVCKPNKKDVNFETSISPPVQMVHRLQTETPSGISNAMGARSSLFFRQSATNKISCQCISVVGLNV